MGDVHYLPPRGHGLPVPTRSRKIRIAKEGDVWAWEHYCIDRIYRGGTDSAWAWALTRALRHLKECR